MREETEEPELDSDLTSPELRMGLELSDSEIMAIGRVTAYWGHLENEIFEQTVLTYGDGEDLPPGLSRNLQFTEVLALWKQRVVASADDRRRPVLERQAAKIESLHDARPHLIHGAWTWDRSDPMVIISQRVAKGQIHEGKATAADLHAMAGELSSVLWWVTYPGGIPDYVRAMVGDDGGGSYMSRSFYAMVSGHPDADQLLPLSLRAKLPLLADSQADSDAAGPDELTKR